ncbi:MAG TPA: helix-turn-helix transcriptional regulator [Thermoanaerobaculia bacterium]|nr:helix-turn-helix transcriptional regulator [Thermoanaerobaculia bacterium]
MPSDRDETSALVRVLRALRGGTQEKMATAARIDGSSLSRYESGESSPRREALERLAGAAGLPLELAVAVVRLARAAAGAPAGAVAVPEAAEDAAFEEALRRAGRATAAGFVAELAAAEVAAARPRPPAAEDRAVSAEQWRRLEPYGAPERRLLVESARELQGWGLAWRLCEESERAAADTAREALELAALGLRAAELAPGSERWRKRLQGYAWGFVGNARRVASDLPGAEKAFTRAWMLWREGAGSDPAGLLGEWRLLDREASLRRALRQWDKALALLDRARAAAPAAAVGRILMNRAFTLEQAGDAEAALAALREAAPLVDGTEAPRLPCVLRFNLITLLCHLGRFADAAGALPEVRELAERLGNRLDLVRVRWLAGRVAAGLGRQEEARAALAQAAEEFMALGNAYDTALVGLELALLELEEGRGGAVRELAREMVWIFDAQGVHREAVAALRLFCRAAEAERATPALARRLVAYLERARHDPRLRFGEAASGGGGGGRRRG